MQREQSVTASSEPGPIAISTGAITEIVGQAAAERCGAVALVGRRRSH